jgi:hypothetical protein
MGLRRHKAIINASITRSRAMVGFIDQPTTLRECRSMTTARYSQPCQVRLMSVTQARSGAATVNSRLSRFGAMIDGRPAIRRGVL